MDNENKENNAQLQENNLLRTLLITVKKNLLLILIVIILATGVGVLYSYMRQPIYTAYCSASFYAEDLEAKKKYQETADLPDGDPYKYTEASFTKQNVNTMNAYLFSVIDFCDEMVVLDRANYYYSEYLIKKKIDPNYKVEDYVKYINSMNGEDGYVFYEDAEWKDKHILHSNVKLASNATKEEKVFYFAIGYVDPNESVAKDKATILICAANREMQSIDYFAGVGATVNPTGAAKSKIDTSKLKIDLIAFAIGIVLAVIVVFIKNSLDNTMRSKESLAQITGAPVLSIICDQEAMNNGRE